MSSLSDEILQDDEQQLAADVVCEARVLTDKSRYRSDFRGTTYYFCSDLCKENFDDMPDFYIWDGIKL